MARTFMRLLSTAFLLVLIMMVVLPPVRGRILLDGPVDVDDYLKEILDDDTEVLKDILDDDTEVLWSGKKKHGGIADEYYVTPYHGVDADETNVTPSHGVDAHKTDATPGGRYR